MNTREDVANIGAKNMSEENKRLKDHIEALKRELEKAKVREAQTQYRLTNAIQLHADMAANLRHDAHNAAIREATKIASNMENKNNYDIAKAILTLTRNKEPMT
jgi:cell division septum initiation protein DivIVA